jgi:AraC-like DNA-binding protein
MPEPGSLVSWTRALCRQLDALELNSTALCASAGIESQEAHDSRSACALSATLRLWALALEATGDPALGLRVSRFVSPTTFHALGYTLVASDSLREVFERIVRYQRAGDDTLHLEFKRAGDSYQLRFSAPCDVTHASEVMDAFAAIYLRTCRNRLGRDYVPLAVHLQRRAPPDTRPWDDLFRAPLFFSAACNMLEFDGDGFDSHLDDALDHAGEGEQPCALIWEQRVRSAIEALLPDGEPSAQSIAEALSLSPRGLQRHLADEGCRYDLLLNQCRQNLALLHMSDPQSSMTEVACLLGFGDADSLSRAFKRWTGLTPAQYRNALPR